VSSGANYGTPKAQPVSAVASQPGWTVNVAKVPKMLAHKGLVLHLRRGPRPAGYRGALYGEATNTRGVTEQFAVFTASQGQAAAHFSPKLIKLVPHATVSGVSIGFSYVTITAPAEPSPPNSKLEEEQDEVAAMISVGVAALAPKALRTEGP
jgi:hypothetical protein